MPREVLASLRAGAAPEAAGFVWSNAPDIPATWQDDQLVVHAAGATDFWSRTHYGFKVHNGHFLHLPDLKGDFIMATTVTTHPAQRFDQAGLMVHISPSCWLKTSCENGGPGRAESLSQLGVVVTCNSFSDWSTTDFPKAFKTVALRVRRHGSDYIVEACVPAAALPPGTPAAACPIKVGSAAPDSPASEWTQLRICHLSEDPSPSGVSKDGDDNVAFGEQLAPLVDALPLSGVSAGLYACSPKPGAGFKAEFDGLTILRGRLPGIE